MAFPRISQFKSVEALRARLAQLSLVLPVEEAVLSAAEGSPLAAPLVVAGAAIGNRWCIHPMEGWDANHDGSPSEHTLRRWRHFGRSGAKLIWGGEAAAVQAAGRANPRQTLATPANKAGLAALLAALTAAHAEAFGTTADLLVGLQLTHSGRFCRPEADGTPRPRIAYHHPLLDARFGIAAEDDAVVLSDAELERLIDDYVTAAGVAREAGFRFVDVKCCHGYLLHEFLSAVDRPGPYGGDFAGRTRLLRTILERIRAAYPDLLVGVRLSVFDVLPFEKGEAPAGGQPAGRPMSLEGLLPYRFAFGANAENPLELDLTEPLELLKLLAGLGVAMVNVSCGSPYYNPHVQRPAYFPPSDGYAPPEDPLVGVARQLNAVRQCQAAVPGLPMVATGLSYLQEFLPQVAQALVREGWCELVGIGRMALSYPDLPADVLAGRPLARKQVCRTFSDCTTAPRNGLISGCYPLDAYYKALPEAEKLKALKRE